MKLRQCPNCNKPKIGNSRFCSWCGTKVIKKQDFDSAMMETSIEEEIEIPFLSISFKCTRKHHQTLRMIMEQLNQIEHEMYSIGARTTPPTPMKHCNNCGKKLLN